MPTISVAPDRFDGCTPLTDVVTFLHLNRKRSSNDGLLEGFLVERCLNPGFIFEVLDRRHRDVEIDSQSDGSPEVVWVCVRVCLPPTKTRGHTKNEGVETRK